MKKIDKPYLKDIFESICKIEDYVIAVSMTKDEFFNNDQVQDAVIRRLEVIGEATKRLAKDFREKYDQIPWRKMAGLRDILIHDYDQVDLEQVWLVIKEDLLLLKRELQKIID